jgi:hypothetical protein
MSVVRLNYWSKLEKKQKSLQTNLNKHESREKAKEYLKEKRDKALEKEKLIMENTNKTENEQPEENQEQETQPEPEPMINNTQEETNNFMEECVQSTPQIDSIIANLKYSPFKLEVDPHDTGSSITIFGSSKSYKTTILKRILRKYYSKDTLTILCAQNVHANIYKDLPKEIIKADDYYPSSVMAMYKINKKLDNKYPFVVVLDDIIDKKSDKDLEKLFLTLRNAKISVVVLLQNVQLLKATARGNSNIVIFRKFNQAKAIEEYVMKEYLANFYPFKDLKMSDKICLYMKITNRHDFFVLDVINNTLTLHREPEADH